MAHTSIQKKRLLRGTLFTPAVVATNQTEKAGAKSAPTRGTVALSHAGWINLSGRPILSPTMSAKDYIKFDGDEMIITNDAPDELLRWVDDHEETIEQRINFIIALDMSDLNPAEYDVYGGRSAYKDAMEIAKQAVRDGDLEKARRNIDAAETMQRMSDELYEKL